jgi:DUF1680 family protein/alpha-L-arabinofuranosidase
MNTPSTALRILGRLAPTLLLACFDRTAFADVPVPVPDRAAAAIALKAVPFDLTEVRLLDGPFQHAMELDRAYLLSLDVDRLLHNFRVNAGLPSNAQPLGGWEEPKVELRGHFVGHYLSACALMYASTGDERLKQKGDAVVAGLAECQQKIGTGYLSAFPEEFFDRVEARQRVWAPYYTLHKIYAGLLDMYVHCGNQQALDTCKKFADWVIARNARLSDEQMQKMLGTEHGGMNEVLANLYGITGERKYLEIAQRFNHMAVIGPASQRQDKLTGLHANTQIPKFIGTAREYELTGQDWLKTASLFFWNTVANERSYVIGGHSDGEMFSPKEKLSEALGPNTTETCNTYNMLKLTRHLFEWDPEASYADYYERALYNHILASQNPENGMTCYYVPLRSGSNKNYSTPTGSFWCCTGTGVENHAKYGDSIYFHNAGHDLYVNLFSASELNWKAKGLKLRQETRYPDEQSTRLTFTSDAPVELTLNIRRPFWATSDFEVRVNGKRQWLASKPGDYAVLNSTWQSGDTVEVAMPFTLRTEAFHDNPHRFAFLYGPLVMCAQIDTQKPYPSVIAEPAQALASLKALPDAPSTFASSGNVFRIAGEASSPVIKLEPFYKMHGDRHYIVYWDSLTEPQWQAKLDEEKAELVKAKELDARTVDQVRPGDETSERDHHQQGENSEAGEFSGRGYRHATDGGWFSWEMKVSPEGAQDLRVTYWGSDAGRSFDVLLDDAKLATQRLRSNRPGRFFDQVYTLAPDVIKGKEHVTIKFQARQGGWAGGVFGLRIVKAEPAAGASNGSPPPARLTVQVDQPGHKVSQQLWGIFFEDINLSADGGIYPELVRNRSFEDSSEPEYWKIVESPDGKAELSIDTGRPLNPMNRRSLRVNFEGSASIVNNGYWGMNLVQGQGYQLRLAARAADGFAGPLTVSLESQSGQTLATRRVQGLTNHWQHFNLELTPAETDPKGRLRIAAAGKGTFWLDAVSVMPLRTWKGHGLRPDLSEMLNSLTPSFMRFPGGCWVEGDDMAHMYHWKETVGDVESRKPLGNIWGYQATQGLGYHEYLQLADDLGAEPLFCINVGMSHRENIPMDRMGQWVQDALDAVEYANGPANSLWGAVRAKNGHPAPFNLKYMEIGNENGGPAYQERYALFYDALKARYPELQLVANEPTSRRPADIVDEHYYNNPEFFIGQAERYDSYPRTGARIFVGEYAVTSGCGQGNLRGAIGEAAFMTGMERNSDVVLMASYAPLFVNVNHKRWNPDLINFDSSRAYGLPSYYVQQMFSQNRGDVVLPIEVQAPVTRPRPEGGAIGVGTWLTQAEFKDIKVTRGSETLFTCDSADPLKGWKILRGDWKAGDGILRQDSLSDNVRAIAGDKSWTDYTYSLKARKLGGAEGFLILFNVQDEGAKSWWNIGGWGNQRHAIEMGGVIGKEVPGHIETGRWYDIRIEVHDDSIKCYLDGQLVHDAKYPTMKALYASATRASNTGEIILKVVNVAAEPMESEIDLKGASKVASDAKVILLTSAKATDENSLSEPTKVIPFITTEAVSAPTFRHVFPGNSVTVLRVKADKGAN